MKKKENSSHKTFNLDGDVITLIKEGSNINAMSQSEFIEFLVNSWDDNVNPIKNLKHLRTKKKMLSEDVSEIERQENIIMDNMQKVEEWRKLKQEEKPEVISNLVRILSRGDKVMAEIVARNSSIRLGVPPMQLIFEAIDELKKRGI